MNEKTNLHLQTISMMIGIGIVIGWVVISLHYLYTNYEEQMIKVMQWVMIVFLSITILGCLYYAVYDFIRNRNKLEEMDEILEKINKEVNERVEEIDKCTQCQHLYDNFDCNKCKDFSEFTELKISKEEANNTYYCVECNNAFENRAEFLEFQGICNECRKATLKFEEGIDLDKEGKEEEELKF